MKMYTSPRQHMMHNILHQFPTLALRLHQLALQFIAEGHELVYFINDAYLFPLLCQTMPIIRSCNDDSMIVIQDNILVVNR